MNNYTHMLLETWIAESAEIENYITYTLAGGGTLALIEIGDDSNRVLSILRHICEYGADSEVPTNINGVCTYIIPLWVQVDLLDSIIEDPARRTDSYMRLMGREHTVNIHDASQTVRDTQRYFTEHQEENTIDAHEQDNVSPIINQDINDNTVPEPAEAEHSDSPGVDEYEPCDVAPIDNQDAEYNAVPEAIPEVTDVAHEESDTEDVINKPDKQESMKSKGYNIVNEFTDYCIRFYNSNCYNVDANVDVCGSVKTLKCLCTECDFSVKECGFLLKLVKKNIIICKFSPDDISSSNDDIIIFRTDCDHYALLSYANQTSVMCCGYSVKGLYFPQVSPGLPVYHEYDMIFKDPYTNTVYAAQKKNTVYLMVNHVNVNHLFNMLYAILMQIANPNISKKYITGLFEKMYKDRDMYLAEQYAGKIGEKMLLFRRSIFSKKEELEKKYNELMSMVNSTVNELINVSDQCKNLNQGDFKDLIDESRSDFIEIMSINQVSYIDMSDDYLNVYTNNLYAMDPRSNKWHDIGTFRIRIKINSQDYDTASTVQIFNTKHQISGLTDGMHAPHVFSTGLVCHGNMITNITSAYKERNMYQVINLILIFLQSVNVDDSAGRYINNWPEVPEEVATKPQYSNQYTKERVSNIESHFNKMAKNLINIHI